MFRPEDPICNSSQFWDSMGCFDFLFHLFFLVQPSAPFEESDPGDLCPISAAKKGKGEIIGFCPQGNRIGMYSKNLAHVISGKHNFPGFLHFIDGHNNPSARLKSGHFLYKPRYTLQVIQSGNMHILKNIFVLFPAGINPLCSANPPKT